MDFRTGNSGNLLQPTVLKMGSGCEQEGFYCRILGDDIAPKVYAILEGGYVMEAKRIADLNVFYPASAATLAGKEEEVPFF